MPARRVSAVIPTYQRRDVVPDAIESALAQTCPPHEVIVVDDGSTDGTPDAIRRRFGSRVQVAVQPNRGPSSARNHGVRIATGDLIAFLDSDNTWRPHHLELVAALFALAPEVVLVGTNKGYRAGDEDAGDAEVADVGVAMLLEAAHLGLTSAVAVSRDAFLLAGGFDEGMWFSEDVDLYIRTTMVGPVAVVSNDTVVRRVFPDSLLARVPPRRAYLDYLERSTANATRLADALDLPAGDPRVVAVHARQDLTLALARLPARDARPALSAALARWCALRPGLTDDVDEMIRLVRNIRRGQPQDVRLDMIREFALAWPDHHGEAGYRLRRTALKEVAVIGHRWRDTARLGFVQRPRRGVA